MSRLFKDQSGYSLVEVMVAILILAIAIIPMVSMFDAGLRAAVLGGNYDTARTFANEKLEEIKALSFDSVVNATTDTPPGRYPEDATTNCNPGPPPESPVTSCTVQTDFMAVGVSDVNSTDGAGDYRTTMAQVTVTVRWSSGSYTTTGLISK